MHPTLSNAVKAARRAGGIIMRASNDVGAHKIHTKNYNDFVTDVDRSAEQAIIETLRDAYPTHGFLGEESGVDNADAENVWIIDPLDGTTNFLHGLPQYCVSIALMQQGQLTQAVVYDPNRNDLFTATKGRGAYLNDKRLRVTNRTKLQDSIIGTGFPFLSKWDIAAGALLVKEAGGIVGDLEGNESWLESGNIAAGNPKVFSQMLQVLAPHLTDNLRSAPRT